MKLYHISTKYGRSPYQTAAYVEANSPKEAIKIYAGTSLEENIAEGMKYRATLSKLPSYFWDMADYCRPQYIKGGAA